MARVNPPLHGRRSHTHTTQGGRGGGEQAAGSWSGSSYSGRNRGVALSSLLQGCADVGAIDGEMPRVKGGMLPLPCFRSPPGGSGRLHAGRRLQSRPSGVPRGRAHVSGVDSDQPGADGVRVRSFALRALSSSAGILKRATSFRAFRAFASTGSFSGAAGNDRRHFRGVAPREVRARDRPRIANHRTTFDACGRARCDSCSAGVGDGVLSGNYDEVTPCAAQYTEQGAHFQARGRESMRYLRTDQARPSGCFPAVIFPVISRVFKSIIAT